MDPSFPSVRTLPPSLEKLSLIVELEKKRIDWDVLLNQKLNITKRFPSISMVVIQLNYQLMKCSNCGVKLWNTAQSRARIYHHKPMHVMLTPLKQLTNLKHVELHRMRLSEVKHTMSKHYEGGQMVEMGKVGIGPYCSSDGSKKKLEQRKKWVNYL